jgi:hypothetical protein
MKAGLLAEFETPEQLMHSVHELRHLGLRELDTFTPYPIKGMEEALQLSRSPVNRATLLGGLLGASFAYFLQWWANADNYPLIVGSRPPHAAPAFVPITFETTVLFAGFSALLSCFFLCGLPELWNPVFEVEGFESASVDRFWVGIDASDGHFDRGRLQQQLAQWGALRVVPFGTLKAA